MSPSTVKGLFWRSVNYFRSIAQQASSPHTTRWKLVRLYFEHAREVTDLRHTILKNLGNRVKDGKLSIPGAEKLPPKLLQEVVKNMENDGKFLAQLVIHGSKPMIIKLAAEFIEKNPESHEAAAEVMLQNPLEPSQLFLRNKLLGHISRQNSSSDQLVAQIINDLTKKTLRRTAMQNVVTGHKQLSSGEQAALGKDPTQIPSELIAITELQEVIVTEYSDQDIRQACQITATHTPQRHEGIIRELNYLNPELAGLIKQQISEVS